MVRLAPRTGKEGVEKEAATSGKEQHCRRPKSPSIVLERGHHITEDEGASRVAGGLAGGRCTGGVCDSETCSKHGVLCSGRTSLAGTVQTLCKLCFPGEQDERTSRS